jgi:hypothetical protein
LQPHRRWFLRSPTLRKSRPCSSASRKKESGENNRAKLQQYQWTETTEVLVKGEDKKTEQELCQYGPDGKVQKTPLGPSPAPPKEQKGLKGRIEIQSFAVDTDLDDPKSDIVKLTTTLATLPDGANYVGRTDLVSESKHIEIKTTNSGYQKKGAS